MSRENVEIVRELYAGWAKGDFRAGLDFFDRDLRFIIDAAITPTRASGAASGECGKPGARG